MICYRTKSNVSKQKQEEEENSVVPSSSRELSETPKPEVKATKKYKQSSKLEEKMMEYLEKSPSKTPAKKEEDMVSYQMAAIEHMIRESVPKSRHINILFSLIHQVQRYIDELQMQAPPNPVRVEGMADYATLTPVPVTQLGNDYMQREIPFEKI